MAKVRTATRTITNSGQRRTLVAISSSKAMGEMPTESLVEYDGLLHLLFDPDVVKVQVQPETFELTVDGKAHRYTPDARTTRSTGVLGLHEFKHSEAALTPEEAAVLRAAAEQLPAIGYPFQVTWAAELRRTWLADNIRLLKRYSRWQADEAVQKLVLDHLDAHDGVVLQDLRDLVGRANYGSLYRLFWFQLVRADLETAALCGSTSVWRHRP